ncbi:MAG: hypothetical protein JXB07_08905 [Anaerolineae bacterium]|nr:hypothetical protein [Anaerolineae bacterium]
MLSLIVYVLPYILGIAVLVALIGGFSNFRRARSAPYFRIRRSATQAVWRWLLIALLCGGGLYATLSIRQTFLPPDLASLWPSTPMPTLAPSTLAMVTPTLDPNATPIDPFAGPPTITPTQPTLTPTPTSFIRGIPSNITPPANATIKISAISSGITSLLVPTNAGTEFPLGTPRIYVFIEFENMADGLSWSRAMLRDGSVIRSESEAWSRGESGVAYYWFDAQEGWPIGRYQIQFYIGEELNTQGVFTVK